MYKKTRDTLLWHGRRVEEVKLFQYLREAANRLSSMSAKELSTFCKGILHILCLGGAENFAENKNMIHASEIKYTSVFS